MYVGIAYICIFSAVALDRVRQVRHGSTVVNETINPMKQ